MQGSFDNAAKTQIIISESRGDISAIMMELSYFLK